ncbi:MAG: mitomycin resistance protein [Pseudanabaena frigida]|uniref:Mitomycin resistance protein n=1 Tax=Pseudanabaena frigida TaxID=945775 RepID=A0A2W4Y4Q7_9CYAN|nr:MAG: mitomycin resistance protein [Pseudanabaena frigida]
MQKPLNEVKKLEDLPNIGKAISADLRSIGIDSPNQLKLREPLDIFNELASVMWHRHDPCLLDSLISAKRFLNGEAAQPWWHYTDERRILLKSYAKEKRNIEI